MKITVLAENTSCRGDVGAEHGLSVFVETCGRRLLFDMGQTDLFGRNADVLGVDLGSVDVAVLSHGHYDHGGGLGEFLKRNRTAPVYVSRYAFGDHLNALDRYIGLDSSLKSEPRLCFCDGRTVLAPGLTLFGGKSPSPLKTPGARGMKLLREGVPEPDPFDHEQYLLAEENGRRILFSGCSHRGAPELCRFFRPDVFIGGFHFSKLDPDDPEDRASLVEAGKALWDCGAEFYTCHCTGVPQYELLKEVMGERLRYLSSGQRADIL